MRACGSFILLGLIAGGHADAFIDFGRIAQYFDSLFPTSQVAFPRQSEARTGGGLAAPARRQQEVKVSAAPPEGAPILNVPVVHVNDLEAEQRGQEVEQAGPTEELFVEGQSSGLRDAIDKGRDRLFGRDHEVRKNEEYERDRLRSERERQGKEYHRRTRDEFERDRERERERFFRGQNLEAGGYEVSDAEEDIVGFAESEQVLGQQPPVLEVRTARIYTNDPSHSGVNAVSSAHAEGSAEETRESSDDGDAHVSNNDSNGDDANDLSSTWIEAREAASSGDDAVQGQAAPEAASAGIEAVQVLGEEALETSEEVLEEESIFQNSPLHEPQSDIFAAESEAGPRRDFASFGDVIEEDFGLLGRKGYDDYDRGIGIGDRGIGIGRGEFGRGGLGRGEFGRGEFGRGEFGRRDFGPRDRYFDDRRIGDIRGPIYERERIIDGRNRIIDDRIVSDPYYSPRREPIYRRRLNVVFPGPLWPIS